MDSDALAMSLVRQHWKQEQRQQQQCQQPIDVPSPEGDYAKDLVSAVQLFLAGGDEENHEDEDSLAAVAIQDGTMPTGGGKADSGAVAYTAPLAEPWPPAPPVSLAAASELDLAPHMAAQLGVLAAVPRPSLAPRPAGPSPEGTQNFMNVLRQRPLPPDISEERKKELEDLIFNCVRALYGDRIRPVLGAVQRRLQELLTMAGWDSCLTDAAMQALLPMCARDLRLVLDLPMYRWTPRPSHCTSPRPGRLDPPVVRLADEPASFRGWVDVMAHTDNYAQDMWDDFSAFLLGAGGAAPVRLPCEPHAAAQQLQRRQLPFFQGLRLGEIEHVVRLAIDRRWFVSSRAGGGFMVANQLVSVEVLDRVLKKDSGWAIKDLEDLTLVLLMVMRRFPEGMKLGLLKQQIHTHTHRTLSEADFQCTELADIFKMAPLRNIFPLSRPRASNILESVIMPPRMEWIPLHLQPRVQQLRLGDAAATTTGMQNFIDVLRQRPLPPEITEERNKELEDLIFKSVRALYGDRIRPVQDAVQRRLREVLIMAGWDRGLTDAAVQALLPMCARDLRLVLDPPMYGDPPVVRLAEEPAFFPFKAIKDLEDLTLVLLMVMQRCQEGMTLSILKQQVETHTHRTFNKADFHCTKLADIFKMAPLCNIFPLSRGWSGAEPVILPPRMEWVPSHLQPRVQQLRLGDAAATTTSMPHTLQWGAMGGVPMQTQPGFTLGAGTGMPPGWGMTPPIGMPTEVGTAGCPEGPWPRPW